MGVESLLLSAGLSAGTAGALSTGLSVLSGVSSLVGGFQSMQEGKAQSKQAMIDAQARGQEQARVAVKEANLERENVDRIRRQQKLAYMKSGVSLEGSPLLVMEQTRARGQENIDEILRAGAYGKTASIAEGRIQAQNAKSAGRQAFIQGLTNAGQSFGRLSG